MIRGTSRSLEIFDVTQTYCDLFINLFDLQDQMGLKHISLISLFAHISLQFRITGMAFHCFFNSVNMLYQVLELEINLRGI